MTREEVKKTILALFEGLATGRWDDPAYVLQSFADDGEWWAPDPVGSMTKPRYMEFLRMAGEKSFGKEVITPFSWIIEGDSAAVEAREMPLPNGKIYRNQYHFVFRVTGGKVSKVKEYCDTAAMRETFSLTVS